MRSQIVRLVARLHAVCVVKQVLEHEHATSVRFVLAHSLKLTLELPHLQLEVRHGRAGNRSVQFVTKTRDVVVDVRGRPLECEVVAPPFVPARTR